MSDITGLTLALVCGFGQMNMLDAYGNSHCVQAETGESRSVEGRMGSCPTGFISMLTPSGPACVDKDVGKAYYQNKGLCPNGSYPALDNWGNRSCKSGPDKWVPGLK